MINPCTTVYEKEHAAMRIALYDARKDPSTAGYWTALLAELVGEGTFRNVCPELTEEIRKARQLQYLAGKL